MEESLFSDDAYQSLALPRSDIKRRIRKTGRFDLIIAGGGVTGASLAWLAAFNGLKVLLLERNDYAWSSVCYPLLPVPFRNRSLFQRWRERREWNEFLSRAPHLIKTVSGQSFVDEAMLVLDTVLAARQEGALCLNHARVDTVSGPGEGDLVLSWRDELTEERHEQRAGMVAACTGAEMPFFARINAAPFCPDLRCCRAQQLLLRGGGEAPQSFLRADNRSGEFCFVQPQPFGCSLTRVSSCSPARPASPAGGEIAEICERAGEQLGRTPDAQTVYACSSRGWCNMGAGTGSRRHLIPGGRWLYHNRILHALFVEAHMAHRAALDALRFTFALARQEQQITPLYGRALPGAPFLTPVREEFLKRARERGVVPETAAAAAGRAAGHARYIGAVPDGLAPAGGVLRGEIDFQHHIAQAETLTDIVKRLELLIRPDLDRQAVQKIADVFAQIKGEVNVGAEVESCLAWVNRHRVGGGL